MQYAAAAVDTRCDEHHEFCALAPFWRVALLTKAREFKAGWRAINSPEVYRGGPESPLMTATSLIIRGELLFARGCVDDGLADVNAGLRAAERCEARLLLPTGYVVLALAAFRRADMRTCLHFVDKLTGEALLGYFGQAAGAWVTAQVAEARGGTDRAAGLIAGIVSDRLVLRQLLVSEPAAASWLVRASCKLGARDLAEAAVTAAATASAEHPGFRVIRGAALHAAGLLEEDSGKLLEAANTYPDRWCGASAREDMAGLLAERRSERSNTVRTFELALGAYTAVGAARDASRVANKLRDFGVRRGVIRPVQREGHQPHGLTNMEFAVAELVSQGHTNNEVGRQLFISRHTVAFHLKKVYQKMSLTSRVELAASWKQRNGGMSSNVRNHDDGGGRW
ncbi:LuxR C-terminal-related transcriptional regulator [Micromonospora sp. WMMA1363]|uniref:helix-turn-helix transcriptional regulator n=1 Tax=Micromonospora sp. WMMA1363 TaxID=3053985 RepID=UPI00259CC007|nr:LuxR family transcriptional regulator [Micromonospora sp. WMMA1363]MDM4723036.1 LuxR C-terminal-related transcriptional regulator [Micromonospora sp. WMMA1363]